jgi:hypothetical protein
VHRPHQQVAFAEHPRAKRVVTQGSCAGVLDKLPLQSAYRHDRQRRAVTPQTHRFCRAGTVLTSAANTACH